MDILYHEIASGIDAGLSQIISTWNERVEQHYKNLRLEYLIPNESEISTNGFIRPKSTGSGVLNMRELRIQFEEVLKLKATLAVEVDALKQLRAELEDSESLSEVHIHLERATRENRRLQTALHVSEDQVADLLLKKRILEAEMTALRTEKDQELSDTAERLRLAQKALVAATTRRQATSEVPLPGQSQNSVLAFNTKPVQQSVPFGPGSTASLFGRRFRDANRIKQFATLTAINYDELDSLDEDEGDVDVDADVTSPATDCPVPETPEKDGQKKQVGKEEEDVLVSDTDDDGLSSPPRLSSTPRKTLFPAAPSAAEEDHPNAPRCLNLILSSTSWHEANNNNATPLVRPPQAPGIDVDWNSLQMVPKADYLRLLDELEELREQVEHRQQQQSDHLRLSQPLAVIGQSIGNGYTHTYGPGLTTQMHELAENLAHGHERTDVEEPDELGGQRPSEANSMVDQQRRGSLLPPLAPGTTRLLDWSVSADQSRCTPTEEIDAATVGDPTTGDSAVMQEEEEIATPRAPVGDSRPPGVSNTCPILCQNCLRVRAQVLARDALVQAVMEESADSQLDLATGGDKDKCPISDVFDAPGMSDQLLPSVSSPVQPKGVDSGSQTDAQQRETGFMRGNGTELRDYATYENESTQTDTTICSTGSQTNAGIPVLPSGSSDEENPLIKYHIRLSTNSARICMALRQRLMAWGGKSTDTSEGDGDFSTCSDLSTMLDDLLFTTPDLDLQASAWAGGSPVYLQMLHSSHRLLSSALLQLNNTVEDSLLSTQPVPRKIEAAAAPPLSLHDELVDADATSLDRGIDSADVQLIEELRAQLMAHQQLMTCKLPEGSEQEIRRIVDQERVVLQAEFDRRVLAFQLSHTASLTDLETSRRHLIEKLATVETENQQLQNQVTVLQQRIRTDERFLAEQTDDREDEREEFRLKLSRLEEQLRATKVELVASRLMQTSQPSSPRRLSDPMGSRELHQGLKDPGSKAGVLPSCSLQSPTGLWSLVNRSRSPSVVAPWPVITDDNSNGADAYLLESPSHGAPPCGAGQVLPTTASSTEDKVTPVVGAFGLLCSVHTQTTSDAVVDALVASQIQQQRQQQQTDEARCLVDTNTSTSDLPVSPSAATTTTTRTTTRTTQKVSSQLAAALLQQLIVTEEQESTVVTSHRDAAGPTGLTTGEEEQENKSPLPVSEEVADLRRQLSAAHEELAEARRCLLMLTDNIPLHFDDKAVMCAGSRTASVHSIQYTESEDKATISAPISPPTPFSAANMSITMDTGIDLMTCSSVALTLLGSSTTHAACQTEEEQTLAVSDTAEQLTVDADCQTNADHELDVLPASEVIKVVGQLKASELVVKTLRAEIDGLQKYQTELQSDYNSVQDMLDDREAEVDRLHQEILTLQATLDRQTNERKNVVLERDEDVFLLTEEKDRLLLRIGELEQQLTDYQEDEDRRGKRADFKMAMSQTDLVQTCASDQALQTESVDRMDAEVMAVVAGTDASAATTTTIDLLPTAPVCPPPRLCSTPKEERSEEGKAWVNATCEPGGIDQWPMSDKLQAIVHRIQSESRRIHSLSSGFQLLPADRTYASTALTVVGDEDVLPPSSSGVDLEAEDESTCLVAAPPASDDQSNSKVRDLVKANAALKEIISQLNQVLRRYDCPASDSTNDVTASDQLSPVASLHRSVEQLIHSTAAALSADEAVWWTVMTDSIDRTLTAVNANGVPPLGQQESELIWSAVFRMVDQLHAFMQQEDKYRSCIIQAHRVKQECLAFDLKSAISRSELLENEVNQLTERMNARGEALTRADGLTLQLASQVSNLKVELADTVSNLQAERKYSEEHQGRADRLGLQLALEQKKAADAQLHLNRLCTEKETLQRDIASLSNSLAEAKASLSAEKGRLAATEKTAMDFQLQWNKASRLLESALEQQQYHHQQRNTSAAAVSPGKLCSESLSRVPVEAAVASTEENAVSFRDLLLVVKKTANQLSAARLNAIKAERQARELQAVNQTLRLCLAEAELRLVPTLIAAAGAAASGQQQQPGASASTSRTEDSLLLQMGSTPRSSTPNDRWQPLETATVTGTSALGYLPPPPPGYAGPAEGYYSQPAPPPTTTEARFGELRSVCNRLLLSLNDDDDEIGDGNGDPGEADLVLERIRRFNGLASDGDEEDEDDQAVVLRRQVEPSPAISGRRTHLGGNGGQNSGERSVDFYPGMTSQYSVAERDLSVADLRSVAGHGKHELTSEESVGMLDRQPPDLSLEQPPAPTPAGVSSALHSVPPGASGVTMVPVERLRHMHTRYLRSESYRRALIFQKRYLLLLFGGLQYPVETVVASLARCESTTLVGRHEPNVEAMRSGAGIGDDFCPSTYAASLTNGQPLTLVCRFRRVARVVQAILRMRHLVNRWKRISVQAGGFMTHRSHLSTVARADEPVSSPVGGVIAISRPPASSLSSHVVSSRQPAGQRRTPLRDLTSQPVLFTSSNPPPPSPTTEYSTLTTDLLKTNISTPSRPATTGCCEATRAVRHDVTHRLTNTATVFSTMRSCCSAYPGGYTDHGTAVVGGGGRPAGKLVVEPDRSAGYGVPTSHHRPWANSNAGYPERRSGWQAGLGRGSRNSTGRALLSRQLVRDSSAAISSSSTATAMTSSSSCSARLASTTASTPAGYRFGFR